MNRAPRLLNRLVLLVLGLIALALGAIGIALAFVPDARDVWVDSVPPVLPQLADFWSPMWSWVSVAVAALVLVLAVIFISRQGGGRTSRLLSGDDVTVGVGVARDVLAASLGDIPDVESVDVRALDTRGETVTQITVKVRRGAQLVELASEVDRRVDDWAALLGAAFPAVVELDPAGSKTAARVR